MIHFSPSNLDINSFLKKFNPKKSYSILDYGCGIGIWNNKLINKKFFKRIYLFDKNQEVINLCKNKYKEKKFYIFDSKKSIKKIFDTKKINTLLLNSVIQYIPRKELEKLLLVYRKKMLSKSHMIIIADVPIINRFIEFFLLFFFDNVRFFHAIKLIFRFKSYKKNNFYIGNLKKTFLLNNFKVSKVDNLNCFKYRRTYILKNKLLF